MTLFHIGKFIVQKQKYTGSQKSIENQQTKLSYGKNNLINGLIEKRQNTKFNNNQRNM